MYHERRFYIDSNNRRSGTHGSFNINIDGLSEQKNYDRIVVHNAILPRSYYLVQENYNSFTVIEDGVSRTVTVLAGNYTKSDFQNQIPIRLNAAAPVGIVYTCGYPSVRTEPDTGKFTWGVTTGHTVSFVFTTNMYEIFGFDRNSTNTFVDSAGVNTLVSTNVLKFILEDSLFIRSSLVGDSGSDILCDIQADALNYGNIRYLSSNYKFDSRVLKSISSNSADFSVTSEDKSIIDFNGCNWTMTIIIYSSIPNPLKVEVIKQPPVIVKNSGEPIVVEVVKRVNN